MAQSGLFERARLTSAFGGNADTNPPPTPKRRKVGGQLRAALEVYCYTRARDAIAGTSKAASTRPPGLRSPRKPTLSVVAAWPFGGPSRPKDLTARGRSSDALRLIKTAMLLQLFLSSYFFETLGISYFALGAHDGASAAFLRGIEINPFYMPCHYELAVAYGVRGRTEEALAQSAIVKADCPCVSTSSSIRHWLQFIVAAKMLRVCINPRRPLLAHSGFLSRAACPLLEVRGLPFCRRRLSPPLPGGNIGGPNWDIVVDQSRFDLKKVVAETAGRTLYLYGFVLQTLITRGVDFDPGDNFVA